MKGLQRGDQTVAPEWSHKPGNPGGGQSPILERGLQHGQVVRGAVQNAVDFWAIRCDPSNAASIAVPWRRGQRGDWLLASRDRREGDQELPGSTRFEGKREERRVTRGRGEELCLSHMVEAWQQHDWLCLGFVLGRGGYGEGRRFAEPDEEPGRGATPVGEAQCKSVVLPDRRQIDPSPQVAREPPDIEDVPKVSAYFQGYCERQRVPAEVAEADPNAQIGAELNVLFDGDRERANRFHDLDAVGSEGAVGANDHCPVWAKDAGVERLQRHTVDAQIPTIKKSGVPGIQTRCPFTATIALAFADKVQLVVLEHEVLMQHAALPPPVDPGANHSWQSDQSRERDWSLPARRDSSGMRRVPWSMRERCLTRQQRMVNRLVAIRHRCRREVTFDMSAASHAVERCHFRYRLNQLLEGRANETGHAIQDDFRYRSVPAGDNRGAGRHRFDHRQPEWLRPVDREEIRVGIPQHLVLFELVDLPDIFDETAISLDLGGDGRLIIDPIDLIDLRGNHQLHPDVTGDLDGPVGSLLRTDPTEKDEIVARCPAQPEVVDGDAVVDGSHPVRFWQPFPLVVADGHQSLLGEEPIDATNLVQI